MKNLISIIAIVFFVNLGMAQPKSNVLFEKEKTTLKFHTIEDLSELKKGQLLELYISRIYEINTILPYMALTNEAGVTLSDLGIRENSENTKILEKQHEVNEAAFDYSKETMEQFIAYADTDKIMLSVLYFEEIIKKLRLGLEEDF
jgi:hypothetical protein